MSKTPAPRPLARGLFVRRGAVVRSGRSAMSRARVIRADGTKGEIEYSVPRIVWFNLMGFVWRFKALTRYLQEDWKWRREPSE